MVEGNSLNTRDFDWMKEGRTLYTRDFDWLKEGRTLYTRDLLFFLPRFQWRQLYPACRHLPGGREPEYTRIYL